MLDSYLLCLRTQEIHPGQLLAGVGKEPQGRGEEGAPQGNTP